MTRIAIIVVTAILGTARAAELAGQNRVAVVESAGGAVVTLKVYDAAGAPLGQGSGFFVEDGRIVTNSHVVEGAARVDVFASDERLLGSVPYVEAMSEIVDIAVLPRLGIAPPATLRLDAALPKAGSDIIVIGAPLGLTNTVSTGIVSAVRADGGASLLQITAPISPGSSGGPVLNEQGAVVGVAVAIRTDGQAINFAVPARDVVALLGSPAGRLAFPAANGDDGDALAMMDAEPRWITSGETITGRLTTSNPTMDGMEYFQVYGYEGRAGERIVLTLTSTDFDAYVGIVGYDFDFEASDDDSGGGTDARLAVTLPRAGDYLVVVTTFDTGETGRYTLSVAPDTGAAVEEWTAYAKTDTGAELHYLPSSLQRNEYGYLEVWTRWTHPAPKETPDGAVYDSDLRLMSVDCARRRIGIVSWVGYLGGRLIDRYTVGEVERTPAVPGSVGAALVAEVCGG